jgi:transcription elongation factor SPT6
MHFLPSKEFEDLDEIIARHIQPIAAFARDILNYKYYKDSDGGNREIMERICGDEKRKAPSKSV